MKERICIPTFNSITMTEQGGNEKMEKSETAEFINRLALKDPSSWIK
jgi:hypothetical protein